MSRSALLTVRGPRHWLAAPSPLQFCGAAARNASSGPATGFRLAAARERRLLGHRARTLLRSQSRQFVIALRERFRKTLDEREQTVGVPSAGLCSLREVAMVRTCIRSSRAIPICNASTGSLPFPSGPRRLASGNFQAAWSRPCTHGPYRPHPVPMAALPASPRTSSLPPLRRVRIVESDQRGTTRSMRSERAAQPVRSFLGHLRSQRREPHPLPGPFDEESLAVKVGQSVVYGAKIGDTHGRPQSTNPTAFKSVA